jgi:hypothetical protein
MTDSRCSAKRLRRLDVLVLLLATDAAQPVVGALGAELKAQ